MEVDGFEAMRIEQENEVLDEWRFDEESHLYTYVTRNLEKAVFAKRNVQGGSDGLLQISLYITLPNGNVVKGFSYTNLHDPLTLDEIEHIPKSSFCVSLCSRKLPPVYVGSMDNAPKGFRPVTGSARYVILAFVQDYELRGDQ